MQKPHNRKRARVDTFRHSAFITELIPPSRHTWQVGCNSWHLVKSSCRHSIAVLRCAPGAAAPRVKKETVATSCFQDSFGYVTSERVSSISVSSVPRACASPGPAGTQAATRHPSRSPQSQAGLVDRAFWLDVACAPVWPDQSSRPVCCLGWKDFLSR